MTDLHGQKLDCAWHQHWNHLHASMCQALADPKRILILYEIHRQPRHVTALAESLGLPQSTVSRHLRVLRQRELVRGERHGPSMIYRLTDARIIEVLEIMQEIMFAAAARQSALRPGPGDGND
ncbi:MAG: metalloregulator ArsR/SmtB family transcription factor [Candidatus Promineifilaceae bacterium]|nr:metalloregulator ArsR/SmtB family transcription factor [Candidatus Promineifilaceae bacterium]